MTKRIQIKYFASIREALGQDAEQVQTGAATLAALRYELVARGGTHEAALAPGRALRMARNQVMVQGQEPLADGDEVAFFPPVTGG